MRLRRNKKIAVVNWTILVLVNLTCVVLPLIDGGWDVLKDRPQSLSFYAYFGGGISFFIVGVMSLFSLLWGFYIDVDEKGIAIQIDGVTTFLPWELIETVTVRQTDETWDSPDLVVVVERGTTIQGRFRQYRDGRDEYVLLGLHEFTIGPGAVLDVLRRYGGEKVDVQDYVDYRASKLRLSQWLAEQAHQKGDPEA